jgi:GNAT superfamily N-acetyltransferase
MEAPYSITGGNREPGAPARGAADIITNIINRGAHRRAESALECPRWSIGGERVADFTIRRGEPRDMPQVIALIRALAEFEKLAPPDEAGAARLTADAAAGRFDLDVAERGGELVAYAIYFATYSSFEARPSLYLEDLFVRPDLRGRGIGEAMLRRLAAEAAARGCARFEWTVLDWNVRAQKFYQSLGARILPEWRVCRVDGAALASLAKPDL